MKPVRGIELCVEQLASGELRLRISRGPIRSGKSSAALAGVIQADGTQKISPLGTGDFNDAGHVQLTVLAIRRL